MRQTKSAVYLTEAERARLRTLIGCGEAPVRMLTRARILLQANQGEGGASWSDEAIAGAQEVHPTTVARIRASTDRIAVGTAWNALRHRELAPETAGAIVAASHTNDEISDKSWRCSATR